jgi:hypothetical protein
MILISYFTQIRIFSVTSISDCLSFLIEVYLLLSSDLYVYLLISLKLDVFCSIQFCFIIY